jgi:hypothetical protein
MPRHKTYTIYNWKKRGVKSDNYDNLYNHHMSINNCQLCNILFDNTSKNLRCLDHDHDTGLYRLTICNSCNANYKTEINRFKSCNKSGHMWITNHKQKYNATYRFDWRYQRKIDGMRKIKCFNTLTKAIAFSFIQLLKKPLS